LKLNNQFSNFSLNLKQNYLEKYRYKNAEQDDLWIELGKAAADEGKLTEVNLTSVMNTWTKQMGHPVITIERINANNIRISQKHFLLDPSSPPTEISIYKFVIF
jgi:aminopeptidase N